MPQTLTVLVNERHHYIRNSVVYRFSLHASYNRFSLQPYPQGISIRRPHHVPVLPLYYHGYTGHDKDVHLIMAMDIEDMIWTSTKWMTVKMDIVQTQRRSISCLENRCPWQELYGCPLFVMKMDVHVKYIADVNWVHFKMSLQRLLVK